MPSPIYTTPLQRFIAAQETSYATAPPVFQSVIGKFFGGKADGKTLELLLE